MSDRPPESPRAPAPAPRPQVRAGESQKDIERGIIRWMLLFLFGTHLIGGSIWLAMYLTGHG
ncbi:hypothetical protein [Embleya sp. MST-111070]|uniref:hypothetical protein n=1 Tax=Embleya sp. MST-111070 TaxID=3398231 RepID=UPI003F740ECC